MTIAEVAFNNLDLTFQRPNNKTINRIQLKPLRTFRVSRRMCSVVYWGHFITLHFVRNISQHFVVEMFVETAQCTPTGGLGGVTLLRTYFWSNFTPLLLLSCLLPPCQESLDSQRGEERA